MVYPKTAPHYAPAENATGIVDGTIVNADINAAAGITEGKLAIASGKILIGTAGGVGAAQTLSGNATVTAAGVVSVLGGAAAAASDFTVIGRADKKIIMKLGDADGDATFRVIDSADADLVKVDSTGLVTLKSGATLDNQAAADTLNISETKIRLTGNTTHVGDLTILADDQAGTIAGLTAAFGDPALKADGTIYVLKDTADANKIKMVSVFGGAYYISAEMTAAA